MGWAELALAGLRGIYLAASLLGFGILLFWILVATPLLANVETTPRPLAKWTWKVFRGSIILAAVAAVVWLVAQAAYLAEADTLAAGAAAVWPVLIGTHFGHVLALRLGLLILAMICLGDGRKRTRQVLAMVATGLAIVLQGWTAHAAAAEGSARVILLGAETLHLLAAGAWLGSLLALFLFARALPPDQGARALLKFSPLGMLCVFILAVTAFVQGRLLIGGVSDLIRTDYGRVAMLKLTLFLAMLLLATINRFHHTRALSGSHQVGSRRRLQLSIGLETGLGLVVILAAAVLADMQPVMHQGSM
jgi:putative copper export protein